MRMLIGQISKATGLSKDGIRYYEELGLIHSYPIQAGSRTYRDYDDTTLERLALIALAKRLHFSLKELVEPLDRLMADEVSREERAEFLRTKIQEVDAKIQDLQNARDQLIQFSEQPDKWFADMRLKELGLWFE